MGRISIWILFVLLMQQVQAQKSGRLSIAYYTGNWGVVSAKADEDPYRHLRLLYPKVTELQRNVDGFSTDRKTKNGVYMPFSVEFGCGFRFADSLARQGGSWEIKVYAGVERYQPYSDNRLSEIPNRDPAKADTVRRELYSLRWRVTSPYVGSDILHFSDAQGRHQRWRFYTGLGIAVGVAFNTLYTYGTDGLYLAHGSTTEDGVYYYDYLSPCNGVVAETHQYAGPLLSTVRINLPLGVEFAFGPRKRFRLSQCLKAGNTWLLGENDTISAFYVSNQFIFTVDLRRK